MRCTGYTLTPLSLHVTSNKCFTNCVQPVCMGIGPMSQERLSNIADELFDSVKREVCEETGLAQHELMSPIFLGMARRTVNCRVVSCFHISCRLSSSDVMARYVDGVVQDRFESAGLTCVPCDRVVAGDLPGKIPGCHLGAIELYRELILSRKTTAQPPPPPSAPPSGSASCALFSFCFGPSS